MKHTKGPWTRGKDGLGPMSVYGPDNKGIWHRDRPEDETEANAELIAKAPAMYAQLASARAIMQKFVDKVDRGMARSIETYAEMKEWLDD